MEALLVRETYVRVLFLILLGGAAEIAGGQQQSLGDALRKAFQHPSGQNVRAVLDVLPRSGDYYIVEGDIPKTEREIREYFKTRLKPPPESVVARTPENKELIIHVVDGAWDFYREREKRRLTYSVDRASFSPARYQEVVENMMLAGRAWMDACKECGVSFEHLAEFDTSPGNSTANFVVRGVPQEAGVLATAFFPSHARDRRVLGIAPVYFISGYNRVGVLRHELGHVLGFRHEHLRLEKEVPGCETRGEDPSWYALTGPDKSSVMHYFCPAANAGTRELNLTELDVTGLQTVYGGGSNAGNRRRGPASETDTRAVNTSIASAIPSTAFMSGDSRGSAALVVRFEGGQVSSDAAAVLQALHNAGLLQGTGQIDVEVTPPEQIVAREGFAPDGTKAIFLVRIPLASQIFKPRRTVKKPARK